MRLCGGVLVFTVFSELFVNHRAISSLLDQGTDAAGIATAGIVALFLTLLVVVFAVIGGDRAKRYLWEVIGAPRRDTAKLVVAVLCLVADCLLVGTITYIRWSVANVDVVGGAIGAAAQQAGLEVATASSFSDAEVVLLGAVLIAAMLFSFLFSFVSTDPRDLGKRRALNYAAEGVRADMAKAAAERSGTFAEDSMKLGDAKARAIEYRALDQVLAALLVLVDDPAKAPRVYDQILDYKPCETLLDMSSFRKNER